MEENTKVAVKDSGKTQMTGCLCIEFIADMELSLDWLIRRRDLG